NRADLFVADPDEFASRAAELSVKRLHPPRWRPEVALEKFFENVHQDTDPPVNRRLKLPHAESVYLLRHGKASGRSPGGRKRHFSGYPRPSFFPIVARLNRTVRLTGGLLAQLHLHRRSIAFPTLGKPFAQGR